MRKESKDERTLPVVRMQAFKQFHLSMNVHANCNRLEYQGLGLNKDEYPNR